MYGFTSAKVYLVAPGCWSPMSRLTQALITLIDDFVCPGLQRGGRVDAIRRMPHDAEVLAIHRDLGKVLHVAQIDPHMRALLEPVGRRLNGLGVSAGAGEVLHARVGAVAPRESLSSVIDGGAPRPGWKLTFHGPSTSATFDSVSFGTVREVSLVALRNTTKTVPHGSRCSGTVVRPSAIL